jgi:hypothetical protein
LPRSSVSAGSYVGIIPAFMKVGFFVTGLISCLLLAALEILLRKEFLSDFNFVVYYLAKTFGFRTKTSSSFFFGMNIG